MNSNHFAAYIFLLMVVASCSEGRIKNDLVSSNTNQESNNYFAEKPAKYTYDYNSSLSEIENYDQGFMDSFNILGKRFRVRLDPDSLGDLLLEVFDNNTWNKNLDFLYPMNSWFADDDVNNDGWPDLQAVYRRGIQVYLFDSADKRFFPDAAHFQFDWVLIDTLKLIYADYCDIKDFGGTRLFTLKRKKQIFLYEAPFTVKSARDSYFYTFRLSKIINNNLEDTVFIKADRYDMVKDDFDFVEYWKDFMKTSTYKKSLNPK